MKQHLIIFYIYFLYIQLTFSFKCDLKFGCLMRSKYFSYLTMQDIDGTREDNKSYPSYKILYIYNDRIVFYTSSKILSPSLEREVRISKIIDEENIERVIYYSDIILDCGPNNNKLCFAQNYPQILKLKTFKTVRKSIPKTPDVKCITLPFFESSYKLNHEKIAFICIKDIRELFTFIKFKNDLSRFIENYQMKLGGDRYNSYNGLLRKEKPYIYYDKNNQPVPVIARLFGKKIILVKNDDSASFVKEFSLFQLRKGNVQSVDKAIRNKIMESNWNSDFEVKPYDNCCIVYPGGII